jgi:sugar/nucleoside kinase (ribokinase family)
MKRSGILAGGNFIIDDVKIIDSWPSEDMLASILRETSANGGGPYNVLKDLAALEAPFPLAAAGLVGTDANGQWIIQDCQQAGIDVAQLQQTDAAPTSYTDAMTVESTGRRTFFHQRGANAHLGAQHFRFDLSTHRWFHLGYLLLLDEMDRLLPDGRTVASQVLEKARAAGIITSVDIVSTEHPQFREIALASLPHTDHLIINEIEAGRVTRRELRAGNGIDIAATTAAASELLNLGVRREVVIHFAEGAVAVDSEGQVTLKGSLRLPSHGFIVGATGAGDAFAAGYIYAKHEGWATTDALQLAVTTAAACLTDPTPSGGLRSLAACRELVAAFAFRELR